MKTLFLKNILLCCVAVLALTGCKEAFGEKESAKEDELIPISVVGLDNNNKELNVLSWYLDKQVSGIIGGRNCCVLLPKKWKPGMTAEVWWEYSRGKNPTAPPPHKETVKIQEYTPEEIGTLFINFLPWHKVKIIVSNYGPRSPFYPLPKEEWGGIEPLENLITGFRDNYYEMTKVRKPTDRNWKWAEQWGLYKADALRNAETLKNRNAMQKEQ